MTTTAPDGLEYGGVELWDGVTAQAALDAGQLAMLEQACRQRDRTDQLAPAAASGDSGAMRNEREAGLAMARLLAALRLPDSVSGKRPQARPMRGVEPTKVSSLDRARAAKSS